MDLEAPTQPWGDGTLQVLASGPLPPNPSELLGSAGMTELIRRLEGQVDLVLIDAPPLLPVTDAAVLGAICSGVLMVVRSNSTRREQLGRAVATVNAVGATVLGTILNMVPTKGPNAYAYGYGYGYAGKYESRSGPGRLARDEAQAGVQAPEFAGRGAGLRPTPAPVAAPAPAPAPEPVTAPSYAPLAEPSAGRLPSETVLPAAEPTATYPAVEPEQERTGSSLWRRLTD